jgi:hypothetical protein
MQCKDCHRIGPDGIPAQIEFEQHCQSRHPLFNERIREPVPHEDLVIVQAFIRTAFSKYAGRNPNEWRSAGLASSAKPCRAKADAGRSSS